MMVTKREFKFLENKVYEASILLTSALEELGMLASDVYGEELIADLCGGAEIEFRHPNDELGEVIRVDDLISIIEQE